MTHVDASVRNALAMRLPPSHVRISWMAMSCVGFHARDTLHAPACLEPLLAVAAASGISCIGHPAMASVLIQERPRETELLTLLSRLRPGNRLLVFNDEADINAMPERCFELVTACVFDHESKRVLRVFDGYKPRRIQSYIDVELNDVSDAALAANAARIAALR